MTALELHIDFNTKFQKVNSNRYRSLEPQEIDWLLNDATLKYMDDYIYPKAFSRVTMGKEFQETKPKYDDVEELVTTKKLKTYKAPIELSGYASDAVFAFLPPNYYKLIDDVSRTVYKCNGLNYTGQDVTLYIAKIQFVDDTTNTIPNLYQNLTISITTTLGTTVLFSLADFAAYNGLSDNDLKFVILNLIKEEINRVGTVDVYWETFNNEYTANSFIFVSTTPFINISMALNGGITAPVQEVTLTDYTFDQTIAKKYYSNRLTTREETRDLLRYSFGNTQPKSPISNLQRGHSVVFHNPDFVVDELIVEYVRLPRKIDLALNRTCELNPNTHSKIVDTAVERIAAIIQAGNLQGLVYNNQNLKQ